jgi:hypothetical protein
MERINHPDLEGQHLIIRKNLIPFREQLVSKIISSPKNTIFYYDFSNIKGINTSGADEIIAKVMTHLIQNEEDKFMILTNLKEELYEHRFNIDYSLNRLDVGIVEKLPDGEANFIGKVSETHRELLHLIYKHKQVTARSIADEWDKKITLASTHLNKLHTLRFIKRQEEQLIDGGRQFVYESLF